MEEPKYSKYIKGLTNSLNAISKSDNVDITVQKILNSIVDEKNSKSLNVTKKYINGLKQRLTKKTTKHYQLIWTPEDKKKEAAAKLERVEAPVATALSPLEALAITQEKLGGPAAAAQRIEAAEKIRAAREAAEKKAVATTRGGSRKRSNSIKKRLTHKLARSRK